MGAGFSRLNCLTIVQTSQGLAEYLLKTNFEAKVQGIVIGYDARHNSKRFAELAATVFINKGMRVWWYEDLVHTPMVPFGVTLLGAAAGVMITASHNPAQDNGYKVYGFNGCQIISPADDHIAAAILDNLEPTTWEEPKEPRLKRVVLTMVKSKYLERVRQLASERLCKTENDLSFIYTPLHGVGLGYLNLALESIGMAKATVVVEQAQSNPDFPTVKYPNPEESGTLDLAISTADEKGVRMVLANDPDADRFAAAEKVGEVWHQFTGDQVGIILAYYLLSENRVAPNTNDFMMMSAVSSQLLTHVAAEAGCNVMETLTGFKWLGNCALDLQKKGYRVLFAYEEALGYMFPDVVLDKDGIAAVVVFLSAYEKYGSLWALLQKLYAKHGHFYTANTYWRSPDVATTQRAFAKVRSLGRPFPNSLADRKIVRWRDLTLAFDSATDDHIPVLPSSGNSQMITCWLRSTTDDDGVRFTIRASGTEPKIKSRNLDSNSNWTLR